MGALTRLIQPDGKIWTFAHTTNERIREIKNPLGEQYTFAYDDAGRVVEEKTFDGRLLVYQWTGAGRVSRIDYPDTTFRTFSHDRAGRLVGEAGSDGSSITYQRDREGRLLAAILEEQSRRQVTLLERDSLGRVVVERQGIERSSSLTTRASGEPSGSCRTARGRGTPMMVKMRC